MCSSVLKHWYLALKCLLLPPEVMADPPPEWLFIILRR